MYSNATYSVFIVFLFFFIYYYYTFHFYAIQKRLNVKKYFCIPMTFKTLSQSWFWLPLRLAWVRFKLRPFVVFLQWTSYAKKSTNCYFFWIKTLFAVGQITRTLSSMLINFVQEWSCLLFYQQICCRPYINFIFKRNVKHGYRENADLFLLEKLDIFASA